ncbi:Tetratricopeptide repeat protein 28 [Fragariocoptes setiger]|uniref:Tetratricopeptide repeat protein 28 n=1 Tax=Fragariocoptes setiger TaxID=1670756 RepID=A0ABQ7S8I0_9ACAR|nr:Tetratricopeptide repeat protein 28 [Fragariocoptes setiger]
MIIMMMNVKLVTAEVSKTEASVSDLKEPVENTTSSVNRERFYEGKAKFEQQDFSGAIMDFTSSIDHDNNSNCTANTYLTYGYRSRAYYAKGLYQQALHDSIRARKLNPNWTEAYYRQGMSLFHLHRHADCLAALAFGLAQAPNDESMLQTLVQAALKSDFRTGIEPIYNSLLSMELHTKPFIVASVIGQELLQCSENGPAVIILESALKIGTPFLKLRGSVYAALSSAYWALNNAEKAIAYARKDLEIEIDSKDLVGQCRVFSNLGCVYYLKRNFRESLEAHRNQLDLAMKIGDSHQVVTALNALGHVHVALDNLSSALVCHSRCLQVLRAQKEPPSDRLSKEYACLGHIYTLKGEYKKARKFHDEHVKCVYIIATQRNSGIEGDHEGCHESLVMHYSNLGFLALKKRNYNDAINSYEQVIKLSQRLNGSKNPNGVNRTGKSYEMRACGALGHIYRLKKEFTAAREWFEKQYGLASDCSDTVGRSQALCNLAMMYQQERLFDKAFELFAENLKFVKKDPYLSAYALSHLGGIHMSKKQYKESVEYYRQSIEAFKEFECSSEIATIIRLLNRNLTVALAVADETLQPSKTPSTQQSD